MTFNGLVLTDLDGTLLASDRSVSQQNHSIFAELKEKNIVVAAATGRSLFSARKVLSPDFPFDFLIFSSGAGILDWKTGEVISSHSLEEPDIHATAAFFIEADLDFSIHHPIPDTHCFHWFASTRPSKDFLERLGLFKEFAIEGDYRQIKSATQLLAVTENCESIIPELVKRFCNLNIIRTTSPLNGHVVWIEVFPKNVSKGHAAQWLSEFLNIDHKTTMSVGNDYNDLAMLEWTQHSYILANALPELRNLFSPAPTNDENGFHFAVKHWLKQIEL